MKFKEYVIFLNFALLFSSFHATAENQGPQKLGQFDNWSVYSKTKNLCYMIAEPDKLEGKYTMRGRVRVVVYRNSNKKENKNVVGFDFGYSFPENQKATIKIDSKKTYKLDTFFQTAWTGSKKQTAKEIINAMRNGTTLIALGQSKRGTNTKDTYSLTGFSKALKKIKNYCG